MKTKGILIGDKKIEAQMKQNIQCLFYFGNKTTINNTTTFKIKCKRDDNEMTKKLQKFNNYTR